MRPEIFPQILSIGIWAPQEASTPLLQEWRRANSTTITQDGELATVMHSHWNRTSRKLFGHFKHFFLNLILPLSYCGNKIRTKPRPPLLCLLHGPEYPLVPQMSWTPPRVWLMTVTNHMARDSSWSHASSIPDVFLTTLLFNSGLPYAISNHVKCQLPQDPLTRLWTTCHRPFGFSLYQC